MFIPQAAIPNHKLDTAFVSPGGRRLGAVAFCEVILPIWQTTERIVRSNLPNADDRLTWRALCVVGSGYRAAPEGRRTSGRFHRRPRASSHGAAQKGPRRGVPGAGRHPICTYSLAVVSTDPNHSSRHQGCLCTALGWAIILQYHGTVRHGPHGPGLVGCVLPYKAGTPYKTGLGLVDGSSTDATNNHILRLPTNTHSTHFMKAWLDGGGKNIFLGRLPYPWNRGNG